MEEWYEYIDDGYLVGTCFLDISKCFDTIDHSILLHKLTKYGIQNKELNWFRSHLTNKTQIVRCNSHESNVELINIGVPQG